MPAVLINWSSVPKIEPTVSTDSLAGFTPITASPEPRTNPSTVANKIAPTSSDGWFGCIRAPKTPHWPRVFRHRVTTRNRLAPYTRSLLLISIASAAAASGGSIRPCRAISSTPALSPRTLSRNSPTVSEFHAPSWPASWHRAALTASSSGQSSGLLTKSTKGTSAKATLAAARWRWLCAATPANWSPDFSSLARPSSSRKSAKTNRSERIVAW